METEKKENEKGFIKKLIDDVAENVKEGATFVGKKVAQTSAKAYVAGSELVAETSDKIHEYSEKNALQREENTIVERQQELTYKFGEYTLAHYVKNNSLHKSFLLTKKVDEIVAEFKANEKKLNSIQKEINKLEKK